MAKVFEAYPQGFGELLQKYQTKVIKVPTFQRGYSWEQSQVTAFMDDLLRFHAAASGRDYFLGPIVILPEGDSISLLDGQQRIATGTIVFAVIRDIAREIGGVPGGDLARDIQRDLIQKDEGPFAVVLGEMDKDYFLTSIQSDPRAPQKPKIRSHKLISDAREYIVAQLKQRTSAMAPADSIRWLKELRNTVSTNVKMVAIETQTEDDAFHIFETLNDRGLRLSIPDLLLNFLMRNAEARDRAALRAKWNEVVDTIKTRDIDRFLRHMWLSRYGDVKSQSLFREIRDHIKTNGVTSLSFASICASEAARYMEIIDASEALGEARVPVSAVVKTFRSSAAVPLLLSCSIRLNLQQFARVALQIEHLIVRYSVFANRNPNDLETALISAARLLREGESTPTATVDRVIADLKKMSPDDSDVIASAPSAYLDRATARYVLLRIADRMQGSTGEIIVNKKTTLEHIFPENPDSEWKNADDLAPLTWAIGNLTMLLDKLNDKAANSPYEVKARDVYPLTEVVMTKEIPAKYSAWTPDNVADRSKALAAHAVALWPK